MREGVGVVLFFLCVCFARGEGRVFCVVDGWMYAIFDFLDMSMGRWDGVWYLRKGKQTIEKTQDNVESPNNGRRC